MFLAIRDTLAILASQGFLGSLECQASQEHRAHLAIVGYLVFRDAQVSLDFLEPRGSLVYQVFQDILVYQGLVASQASLGCLVSQASQELLVRLAFQDIQEPQASRE